MMHTLRSGLLALLALAALLPSASAHYVAPDPPCSYSADPLEGALYGFCVPQAGAPGTECAEPATPIVDAVLRCVDAADISTAGVVDNVAYAPRFAESYVVYYECHYVYSQGPDCAGSGH